MNDNSAASHDLVMARPHMGRVTGGGGAGPALASTEKRGTSRELMSSGIPSSRLKDLEKEPSFGEVLSSVMSSALAFSIPRRRNAILGTESRPRSGWLRQPDQHDRNSHSRSRLFASSKTHVHRSRGDEQTVEGADIWGRGTGGKIGRGGASARATDRMGPRIVPPRRRLNMIL